MEDWAEKRAALIRHHRQDLRDAVWYTGLAAGLLGVAVGILIGWLI